MINFFIDPSYKIYYENKLFDLNNKFLNRDNTLNYFYNLRERLKKKGISLNTADKIFLGKKSQKGKYISLGIEDNFKKISEYYPNIKLKSIAILEPPVVAPKLYRKLNIFSKYFDKLYLHSNNLNNYSHLTSFKGSSDNIKKLYWPIEKKNFFDHFFWKKNRKNYPVLIQANKKPINYFQELYSFRINQLIEFDKLWKIDLFGYNWDQININNIFWMPFIRNYFFLKKINKGPIDFKYDILSKYEFCLCIENMSLEGYITEKIFDCFFCGTIPIYKGSPDIKRYIPENTFVFIDDFKNISELIKYLLSLKDAEKKRFRLNILNFLNSSFMSKHYFSIDEMFI